MEECKADRLALYFGCIKTCGHYLWDPRNMSNGFHFPLDVKYFPWTMEQLDHDLLDNRGIQAFGKVMWVAGGVPVVWHAFLWWDCSVDHRSGSHSGFYVRGFEPSLSDARPAFGYAKDVWRGVVERQRFPLVFDINDPECVGVR
jgi:hypothetical protein